MKPDTADEKFVYTKKDVIALYAFEFVWYTGIIAIFSGLFGLLPNHYLIYALIQGIAYFKAYKHCQYCISNNIKVLREHADFDSANYHNKMINDDWGSIVTKSDRIETNLFSGASFTSNNPLVTNNKID